MQGAGTSYSHSKVLLIICVSCKHPREKTGHKLQRRRQWGKEKTCWCLSRLLGIF